MADVKVTIAFSDDELYRAIRVRAAHSGRQIRDIVEEALEMWLTAQENAEDTSAAKDALAEYDEVGGVDADAFFQRLVAEGRIEYDAKSGR
jgi:plasmid stability protein